MAVPDSPSAAAVAEATDEYVAEQDSFGNFLAECCRVEYGRPVRFEDFLGAYHHWLETHGENPRAWSRKRLAGELQRRGFNKHRPMAGEDRGKTVYTGLTLLVSPPSTF
jgi:putative DNA primase/helicase